jgi:hypothetical protein
MGSGTGRNHAAEVSGHDDIRIGATHSSLGALPKRIHATGPHVADPTTQPHIAEAALRLLRLVTIPHGLNIIPMGFGKQLKAIIGDGYIFSGIKHRNLLIVLNAPCHPMDASL